jgi:hypothetical protein
MKHRFKTLGLALVAILAFGVVSADAWASEALEFSTETKVTGTSGKGSLTLEGATVKCGAGTSTLGAGKTSGTFKLVFKECKNAGKSCISLGQLAGSGLIEATGDWQLVRTTSGDGLWFLLAAKDSAEALHLECEVAGLILVWGSFLSLVEEVSKTTFKVGIETEGSGSTIKQKVSEREPKLGETESVKGLEAKIGTGAEKAAGVESAENLLSAEKATELVPPERFTVYLPRELVYEKMLNQELFITVINYGKLTVKLKAQSLGGAEPAGWQITDINACLNKVLARTASCGDSVKLVNVNSKAAEFKGELEYSDGTIERFAKSLLNP